MVGITDLLDSVVDDQIGIIRYVREVRHAAGAPNLIYMSAETCTIDGISALYGKDRVYGTGVAATRERALSKAVGEAVERYCAIAYNCEEHSLTSYTSAPFRCIQPELFALYSAKQYSDPTFPFSPFTRDTPIRWVPALDIVSGDKIYVPADFVSLSYGKRALAHQPLLAPLMSTGLACHTNQTIAAISGICEVVERDAISIAWQAKLSRPHIRLSSLTPKNQHLVQRLSRPQSSVDLLDFTLDHGITVVFSTMKCGTPNAPALLVGAGCSLDPEVAVQKSLEELAQVIPFAQREKQARSFSPGANWEYVVDPKSHAAVYYDQANARKAAFLFASSKQISFQELRNHSTGHPETDLRRLIEHISSVGHTVLLADITTEDVRSVGLHVFRALIPGFHPLFMGHRFRALGGNRLWMMQKQFGGQRSVQLGTDNPFPHPFA